jgi:hypothetical protein
MILVRRVALHVVLAFALFPSVASADTVKHFGSIVVEVIPEDPPPRCGATAYWQWSELPGAKSYNLVIKDSRTTTYNLTWPPYTNDGAVPGGKPTPKNVHRHGISSISGPNCQEGDFLATSRWEIISFTATFDDRERIVGTATDAAGAPIKGVRISISGKSKASASTNAAGAYAARVKKGKHTVTAPEGFCLRGVKKCTRSKEVNVNGTEAVHFTRVKELVVFGTIRDEFRRGLGGVRVSLKGADQDSVVTDAAGRYRTVVSKEGTYELTAVPAGRPRGPYERYFIVQGGKATEGTAADVTLTEKSPSVTLDWELDRQLQFELLAPTNVEADGFSRMVATLRVRTQRADPAPGVEMRIDPAGDGPRAVICTPGADSRPLWPSLQSDGTVSPVGLPVGADTTTKPDGTIAFRVFPGTQPGQLRITGSRRTDVRSTFSLPLTFAPGATRPMDQATLRRGLQQSGPRGTTFFGSQDVVFEVLATRRGDTDLMSGYDAVPVVSGAGKRGIAFFARGRPPAQMAGGGLVPSDEAFVFDNSLLDRITSYPALPSLKDWAAGQSVAPDRPDGRTFLGWPLPTRANGGLGTCLDRARPGAVVYAAHSPVALKMTDAKGKTVADTAPGAAFKIGGTSYVVAPSGAHALTVTGTGAGPVVLETQSGKGSSVASFRARKGARVKLAIRGDRLPKAFRFAGDRVKAESGMPLTVRGLPRSLRAGRAKTVTLTITDALGDPVPFALVGAGSEPAQPADAKGRLRVRLHARRRGSLRVEATAPGALTRRSAVRVR